MISIVFKEREIYYYLIQSTALKVKTLTSGGTYMADAHMSINICVGSEM